MIVTGSYKLFGVLSELCKWSDVNNRIIRKVQIIQCNPLLTQFAWGMHAKGKEILAITRWKTEYIHISINVFIYSYQYITVFSFDNLVPWWQWSVYFIENFFFAYKYDFLLGQVPFTQPSTRNRRFVDSIYPYFPYVLVLHDTRMINLCAVPSSLVSQTVCSGCRYGCG